MPPKRKSARAPQHQNPQPAQSDYDTDTAALSAATMAPPPARTNTELNLLVLRRYEPNVERLISIAPFAVVYLFSPESQQWEKSGVEGTLFVCQLAPKQDRSDGSRGYSRYSVLILNRKSMDNFAAELSSGEDIEVTEQYVILQVTGEDGTPNIYGLWIFSEESESAGITSTREVVAAAMQECAVRAEEGRRRAAAEETDGYDGHVATPSYNLNGGAEGALAENGAPLAPLQAAGQQIDLMTLFGKSSTPSQASNHQSQPQAAGQPLSMPPQQARFASTADTDFFRSLGGSAAQNPPQPPQPPPTQQNALLDLFKSARKG